MTLEQREQGLSTKVAKWLLKHGQCNGSAVVSPFPVYQSSSDSPSCGLNRFRGGRGGRTAADKIIGLLGPVNGDQQRQIHDLLKQSKIHVNSDSDSDENSELEVPPCRQRKAAPSPLHPLKTVRKSVRIEKTPPPLDIQTRQRPRQRLERNNSFQFPVPPVSGPYSTSAQPPVAQPPVAQRFPLPTYPKASEVFQPSASYYSRSVYQNLHTPWYTPPCSPRPLSDTEGTFSPTCREPPRRSFARSTFVYSEPQSPYSGTFSQSPYMSPRPVYPRSPYPSQPEVFLHELLGCGSYASVYRGEYLQTGQPVAVKALHGEISAKEVLVLSTLDHQNIVKYLGTTRLKDGRFCILLELMKYSLALILKDSHGLEEAAIRRYIKQILSGLEYLHLRNIVHRDIKCANILLDAKGTAKLADFGLAKEIGCSYAKSCKGTFFYMAPEVLLTSGREQYGLAADIWSLGCTVIEMAGGKPPWNGFAMMPFYECMREGHSPPIPKHLSMEAVDFIRRCLTWQPTRRPTASALLRHPFVTGIDVNRQPF